MGPRSRAAGLGLLALVAGGVCSARADWVIQQLIEGQGQREPGTIRVHGEQMRTDLPGQLSILVNRQTGETIHLLHGSKTYARVSREQSEALAQQMEKLLPATTPKLAATGQTLQISGFAAQQYAWNAGVLKFNFWVTPAYQPGVRVQAELDKFQQTGLSAAASRLMPALAAVPGLRVRTEMELQGKRWVYTITSLQETPVPEDTFAIPAGYREVPFAVQPLSEAPAPAPAPTTPPPNSDAPSVSAP